MFSSGPIKGWLGKPLPNPRGWAEWEWNDGETWSAMPFYWGGSFWGRWPFGTIAPSMQYGSVAVTQTNATYPSYQIETSSPGAELLADYGLEQTQCGQTNLVVIWGPQNSPVCGRPNARVRAGNYEPDPASLTIRPLIGS
jgi:hypothetical protein